MNIFKAVLAGAAAVFLCTLAQAEVADRIVAVVNDEVITLSEWNSAFEPYRANVVASRTGADREKAIYKIVLDAVSMAGGECCPPVIIGVAVGGYGRDYTDFLSRKALYRTPLNKRHSDPYIANLEKNIFEHVNNTGIGPLGVGGNTTCLAVHMEVAGTHTAGWSVGVGFSCWSSRYSKAVIIGNKEIEYRTHPNNS